MASAFGSTEAVTRGVRLFRSSLTIVPTAKPGAATIALPVGFERPRPSVSLRSRLRSPLIATAMVRLVWPGWKVNVPLVDV